MKYMKVSEENILITNLNRLHKVYNGELYGRGVGKTFLKIHTLAGIIEVGQFPRIFVVIGEWHDKLYLMPMIGKIFEEHELIINKSYLRGFDCNDKHIRFTTNKDLYEDLMGYHICDIVRIEHHN